MHKADLKADRPSYPTVGRTPAWSQVTDWMSRRPHVVIFNPDQWRGDVLGHVGSPAAVTPDLDRLCGTDGVSFRHTFTQDPVCTPSRC